MSETVNKWGSELPKVAGKLSPTKRGKKSGTFYRLPGAGQQMIRVGVVGGGDQVAELQLKQWEAAKAVC